MVITLSTIQCNYNRATVLDFCLHEVGDPTKRELLLKLSEKDQGVYSLFNGLIRWDFLGTVQDMIKRWCYEEVSVPADKIFSHHDYALLLSSLSNVMLESPESGAQARSIFMELWRCDRFNEHKKVAVDLSNGILPVVPMKGVLAGLIVDWKRDDNKASSLIKENEILEILQFAKSFCSDENFMGLKKHVANTLRITGRPGMKKGIDYGELAERLFDKAPIHHGGGGGSGDPQSMLGAPGISGLSSRSK